MRYVDLENLCYPNCWFFHHIAIEKEVLTNYSAPQCFSSVSWISPGVVSYLSSAGRGLYEATKQNMCFLKSLFNVKALDSFH